MDPLDFFGALYETAAPGDGVVELRALKNAGGFHDRLFTDDEALIRSWASRYRSTTPIGAYYGVALRKHGSITGKKTDISVITALWADIDVVKNGWDMTLALGNIKSHPNLRPSAIVDSGHGYHLYWVLDEPILLADYDNGVIDSVEGVMRQLAEVFGGDNTTDVTRVLRVPGTWNTKDKDKPKQVKVVMADWREWTRSDLRDAAKESTKALDKDGWISRAEMQERVKAQRAKDGIITPDGLLPRKFNSVERIWDLTRFGGGPAGSAFMGLDEAIMRATAWWAWNRPTMPDEQILEFVLAEAKRIKLAVPGASWDQAAEYKEAKEKLRRFQDKMAATDKQRSKGDAGRRKRNGLQGN